MFQPCTSTTDTLKLKKQMVRILIQQGMYEMSDSAQRKCECMAGVRDQEPVQVCSQLCQESPAHLVKLLSYSQDQWSKMDFTMLKFV